MKLACHECGIIFGNSRGLYWHYKIEHEYPSLDAYEVVGECLQNFMQENIPESDKSDKIIFKPLS